MKNIVNKHIKIRNIIYDLFNKIKKSCLIFYQNKKIIHDFFIKIKKSHMIFLSK